MNCHLSGMGKLSTKLAEYFMQFVRSSFLVTNRSILVKNQKEVDICLNLGK